MARKPEPFNNPFTAVGKTLKKELEKARAPAPPPKPAPRPEPPSKKSDEQIFQDAMRDIRPMGGDQRGRAPDPDPPSADDLPAYDEDAEALAELIGLVEGSARFEIADTQEFVEGGIRGLDRRVLQKLRRGDFAWRSHLDLHGLTRDEAKEAVERFLLESQRNQQRCVLIVHGRGLNSKDNIPVLKNALLSWLERGRIARAVLAFCTARPHDGGAGAVYVLLRRG